MWDFDIAGFDPGTCAIDAALPAPPTVEDVPALPIELAPRPMVDAEPPAAALPAVPAFSRLQAAWTKAGPID